MKQQISRSEFVQDAGRNICKLTPCPAHPEKQVFGFKSQYFVGGN
jgi:hypothetical protein